MTSPPTPAEWQPPQLEVPARRPRAVRPQVEGSGYFAACGVAAVLSGAGAAVASWWLIGNLSARSRYPGDLEYASRAPTVPHGVVGVFGPVALGLALVIVAGMIVGAARQIIDRRWLRVVGALAFAGFLFAAVGRMETAGTIGANIGGGIAVLFGLPLVAALIVWAGLGSRWIMRARTA